MSCGYTYVARPDKGRFFAVIGAAHGMTPAIRAPKMKSPADLAGLPFPAVVAALQPRDHADIDGVALSDLGQGLAGRTTLDGFRALVVAQLALAAEFNASRHSPLTAYAGALADQFALEFGNAGKQRRQQAALSV
jgi:hypothetical protein